MEKTDKQAAQEKQWARITRQSALDTLRDFPSPFVKLSYARDSLTEIIEQKECDEIAVALLARALIVEAVAEIERSLLRLRIIIPRHASVTFLTEREYEQFEPKE